MSRTINYGQPINLQSPLNRGLVGWWLALPQRMGGGRLLDLCKPGNHGTLTNGPTWQSASGRPGGFGSLLLDATNDYVSLTSQSLGTVHSVAAWVNITTTGGIFNGATYVEYMLYTDATNITYYVSGGYAGAAAHGGLTGWHHIATTRNGTAVEVFKNGVSLGTPTLLNNAAATLTGLGNTAGGGGTKFGGNIDDLRVATRVWSADEIRQIYNDSRTGYPQTLCFLSTKTYFLPLTTVATSLVTSRAPIVNYSSILSYYSLGASAPATEFRHTYIKRRKRDIFTALLSGGALAVSQAFLANLESLLSVSSLLSIEEEIILFAIAVSTQSEQNIENLVSGSSTLGSSLEDLAGTSGTSAENLENLVRGSSTYEQNTEDLAAGSSTLGAGFEELAGTSGATAGNLENLLGAGSSVLVNLENIGSITAGSTENIESLISMGSAVRVVNIENLIGVSSAKLILTENEGAAVYSISASALLNIESLTNVVGAAITNIEDIARILSTTGTENENLSSAGNRVASSIEQLIGTIKSSTGSIENLAQLISLQNSNIESLLRLNNTAIVGIEGGVSLGSLHSATLENTKSAQTLKEFNLEALSVYISSSSIPFEVKSLYTAVSEIFLTQIEWENAVEDLVTNDNIKWVLGPNSTTAKLNNMSSIWILGSNSDIIVLKKK